MYVWLVKVHVEDQGKETLKFRAELEELLQACATSRRASANWMPEQVDITFLAYGDGYGPAMADAAEVCKRLGVPDHRVAVGVVGYGDLPEPPA